MNIFKKLFSSLAIHKGAALAENTIDLTPYVSKFETELGNHDFQHAIILAKGEGFDSSNGSIAHVGYAQKIAPLGSFTMTMLKQLPKGIEFLSTAFGIRGEFGNNALRYFIPSDAVASVHQGSGLEATADRQILVPKHPALTSFLRASGDVELAQKKIASEGLLREFWSPKGAILRDGSYEPTQERIVYQAMLTLAHKPNFDRFVAELNRLKDMNTKCEEKGFPEFLLVKVAYGIFSNSDDPEQMNHEPFTAMVREVISRGANVNVADSRGDTPLIQACRAGHVAAVEVLLAAGADPDATNDRGETSLSVAKENKRAKCCQLLNHIRE